MMTPMPISRAPASTFDETVESTAADLDDAAAQVLADAEAKAALADTERDDVW